MLASGLVLGQRHMGQWITPECVYFGLLAERVHFPHMLGTMEKDFRIDAAVDH